MLRRWIALFWLLTFAHTAREANASDWLAITPQELRLEAADIGDPQADAVILFREGELNDNDPEGTNLKVYIRIKIFNDRGRRFADVQLPYSTALGRITDIEARTIRPDGSVVEVRGRDILDKLVLKTRHSVHRAKVFSMPAVEAGAIIEYRYRQVYPKGFRYFALDLQSELFTRQLHYAIQPQAASRFEVRWVPFNAPDSRMFEPKWNGRFDIRAENIPPFRREPMMPPELTVKIWGWLYYSDELETDPEKYWLNYSRRMHERASYETRPTGAIRRVVDQITLANDSQQQRIARVYNYVQSEIRNIGSHPSDELEADASEYKKNATADQTLKRRYGTPREINRLFISMLRAARLDARVAELTARDENFFRRSFPDAFQFNSEVTAVVASDGSMQFFDPGTPYCPLGMLSWEKEATTALVYDARQLRFVETPLNTAALNREERVITVSPYGDGRVDVKVESLIAGQRAIELRNEVIDLTPDDRRKRFAGPVRELFPAAIINEPSVAVSNLTNAAAPAVTSYSFSVPRFALRAGSRLLLRPALLSHPDETLFTSPRRANRVYLHYPWSESERVVIETPEGFEIEQLPDPVSEDIGAARYRATFTRDGTRVIYERNLTVNDIIFSPDQYP
ncbi:MAG: DUF3857 and transglutaminase domain-containing protein, partial [Acidobacteriota bacterium]